MFTKSVDADTDITPVVTLSFTRPENITAYAANDAVGIADSGTPANAGSAIQTIATGLPAGSTLEFTDTTLRINLAAVTASMTTFFLHLYDASPTAILDNAAWDLVSADRTSYLGSLALGTPVDMGSTLFVQVSNIGKRVQLSASSTSLYGVLVTTGGYTPTSAEAFSIRLFIERK